MKTTIGFVVCFVCFITIGAMMFNSPDRAEFTCDATVYSMKHTPHHGKTSESWIVFYNAGVYHDSMHVTPYSYDHLDVGDRITVRGTMMDLPKPRGYALIHYELPAVALFLSALGTMLLGACFIL